MQPKLTSKQKILALIFYEMEESFKVIFRNTKTYGEVPKHKYYAYFNIFQKRYLFNNIQDEGFRNIIKSMDRLQWYGVAKNVGFKSIVQVETINRYKKIDEDESCAMTEDEARDFATSFFPIIGKDQLAIDLSDDNWKYDYTEILEISFDMDLINQIQEEHSDLASVIRYAVRR
jgi:hypothetical protein